MDWQEPPKSRRMSGFCSSEPCDWYADSSPGILVGVWGILGDVIGVQGDKGRCSGSKAPCSA